jgi:hypothetical protein
MTPRRLLSGWTVILILFNLWWLSGFQYAWEIAKRTGEEERVRFMMGAILPLQLEGGFVLIGLLLALILWRKRPKVALAISMLTLAIPVLLFALLFAHGVTVLKILPPGTLDPSLDLETFSAILRPALLAYYGIPIVNLLLVLACFSEIVYMREESALQRNMRS